MQKKPVAIAATVAALGAICASLCCCCSFGGWLVDSRTQGRIAEADRQWDAGNHFSAATTYREMWRYVRAANKPRVLGRIVDHAAESGNILPAQEWIEKGINEKITATYQHAKSQEMHVANLKMREDRAAEVVAAKQKVIDDKAAARKAEAEERERKREEARLAAAKAAAEEARRITISRPGYVSREQFGDKWPLTVEEGELECVKVFAIVFHHGGKIYAVNGAAITMGYRRIESIWRPDPTIEGVGVSMGPLIQAGRKLCK